MAYRNIHLHPVLRFIYLFLRCLVWLGVSVFYRHRLVLGREHLRFDGPAIVIANHPSTLLDVLNPALHIRQEMFFLANYGMFRHPVTNWLFRRLYCIPVKRREDVAEGENRNNEDAFKQSFKHLAQYGVLFIAPEGTSWMNRFIRPLKTGTARIAFGAEAKYDWKLDLKIIPAGLSYTAPHLFRSDVVVNFGAPVYPRDWAAVWSRDKVEAVDALTEYLANQFKTLTVDTRDEAGEQLTGRLEEILQNEYPLPQKAAFDRSRQLVKTALDDTVLRDQTNAYFEHLNRPGLTDAGIAAACKPAARFSALADGIALISGFPLFAAGYVFWFLPCWLPWWLNKKLNLYIGYSSTVKILAGLITFPLALWGAYRVAGWALHNGWAAFLVTGVFVVLGFWVEMYTDRFNRFRARYNAARQPEALQALVPMRASVLKTLKVHLPEQEVT